MMVVRSVVYIGGSWRNNGFVFFCENKIVGEERLSHSRRAIETAC